MWKIEKNDIREVIEDSLSWVVVIAMYIYGFFKLVQFRGAAAIDTPVSQTTGLELMWAFYGYSKPYIIILGVLEILGGTLIFFKKTRVIGCLFTSAILINIILQDYFYDVPALRVAVLYQSILFIILWLHKDKLILGVHSLLNRGIQNESLKTKAYKWFIAFVLFAFFKFIEYLIT